VPWEAERDLFGTVDWLFNVATFDYLRSACMDAGGDYRLRWKSASNTYYYSTRESKVVHQTDPVKRPFKTRVSVWIMPSR
jgi:hypothetical protein